MPRVLEVMLAVLLLLILPLLNAVLDCLAFVIHPDWLPRPVRRKLESLDESGMGYWIVTVLLKNGDRISGVCVTPRVFGHRMIPREGGRIRMRDVVNLESDGYQGRYPATGFQPLESE